METSRASGETRNPTDRISFVLTGRGQQILEIKYRETMLDLPLDEHLATNQAAFEIELANMLDDDNRVTMSAQEMTETFGPYLDDGGGAVIEGQILSLERPLIE